VFAQIASTQMALDNKVLEQQQVLRQSQHNQKIEADTRKEHEERVETMNARYKKLENTAAKQKQEMRDSLKIIVAKVEDVELSIHSLRAAKGTQLESSVAKLKSIDHRLHEEKKACAERLEAIRDELVTAMSLVTDHQMRVNATLQGLQEQSATYLSELGEIELIDANLSFADRS